MKLTIHLHLVPRSGMVDLYFHSQVLINQGNDLKQNDYSSCQKYNAMIYGKLKGVHFHHQSRVQPTHMFLRLTE
jgi:hypothetical protein